MPPFTDASMPEVIARVAIAWVKLNYRHCNCSAKTPAAIVQDAINTWPLDALGLVPSALAALQFHLIRGGTSQLWLNRAVFLSRFGKGFRRCWYDDYKGGRRR